MSCRDTQRVREEEGGNIIDLKEILAKAAIDESAKDIRLETLDDYGLGGVDCEICGNTGYILIKNNGELFTRECPCMKKRRSLRSIRKSGISDMLSRYTFENYETPDEKREKIKKIAENYVNQDTGWFFIAGKSGSGKTHICTAICKALIEQGKEVKYMLWRDESVALKSCVTEEEYQEKIQKLKLAPVLYIDDFWKGNVTDADVNLTFEILNSRYIDSGKRTVISSEMTLPDVISRDEAIGSRIYERSRGFRIQAPNENWRLRR